MIVQLRNVFADRRDLLLENAALRQQLAVYQRNGARPKLTSADRRFWVWLSRAWPRWHTALFIVQPETVIRWHRDAWKRYWTWKSRRDSRGRPRIAPEVRDLIERHGGRRDRSRLNFSRDLARARNRVRLRFRRLSW